MIRLAFLIFLSFCSIANAQLAGGLQFPGPGTVHSASTPALTYIGQIAQGNISGQGTAQELLTGTFGIVTSGQVSIGIAATDRLVVMVETSISTIGTVSSAKIGGNAAALDCVFGGTTPALAIFSLNVPTGTMASVEVNWSGNAGYSVIDVYTITGLSSFTKTGCGNLNNLLATTISTTLNTVAGGIVIATSSQYGPGVGTTTDLYAGGTLTYTLDQPHFQILGSSVGTTASNSSATTNAASNVTSVWNGAVQAVAIIATSYR